MKREYEHILMVLFEALWLYFLLVWVYIAIENLLYPAQVATSNLAAYFPVPQNLLAVLSFALSFVFFFLWRYLKETKIY
jgi:hypothetical protein